MASGLHDVTELSRKNGAIYDTLPSPYSIRLLNIGGTENQEKASYSLTTIHDYRKAPSFDALSYCWGNAKQVAEVTCNGKTLLLTSALDTALKHFPHHSSTSHFLWVDAVCINQDDDAERSQQVSIMKQIYTFASKVLVWLGPSDEPIMRAMQNIRETTDNFRTKHCGSDLDSYRHWWNALHNEDKLAELARTLADGWCLESLWSQMRPIFECEWFRRIWVVQEVQSCENTALICGGDSIDWCIVALVAKAIMKRHNIMVGDKTIFSFVRARAWRQYALPHAYFMSYKNMSTAADVPFLRILHHSRCFKATDPRDKIFSMLQQPVKSVRFPETSHQYRANTRCQGESSSSADDGVTDDPGKEAPGQQHFTYSGPGTSHLNMMPDYKKTVYAVYADLAERTIVQTRSLDILTYRLHGQQDVPEIPSWIPHWMVDTTGWITPIPTWQYHASGGLPSQAQICRTTLDLRGISLGAVSQASWTLTNRKEIVVSSASHHENGPYMHVADLDAMVRTITHDQRFTAISLDDETVEARARKYPRVIFADFAAWLLARSQIPEDYFYCHLRTFYCDFCRTRIVNSDDAESSPIYWYKCDFCAGGDHDVCGTCYRKGKTCSQPSDHKLRLMSCAGIHFQHNEADLHRLQIAAPEGSSENFYSILHKHISVPDLVYDDKRTHRLGPHVDAGRGHRRSFVRSASAVRITPCAGKTGSLYACGRLLCRWHDGRRGGADVEIWRASDWDVPTVLISHKSQ